VKESSRITTGGVLMIATSPLKIITWIGASMRLLREGVGVSRGEKCSIFLLASMGNRKGG